MKHKRYFFIFGWLMLAALLAASCQQKTPEAIPITPENYNIIELSVETVAAEPAGIRWSPDSQSILVLSAGGGRMLDAWKLETIAEFSFNEAETLQVSSDGKVLASAADDQTVRLIDAENAITQGSISAGYAINNIDFSPDGKSLLTSSFDELQVDIWDVASGDHLKTLTGFETAAPVYHASFAAHSQHVVWLSRGRVQISDAASGFLSMPFDHQDWVTSWALSSDGQLLATTAAGDVQGRFVPNVFIWDTASGEVRSLMNSETPYETLALCPNTHIIAVAEEGMVTLINLDVFSTPAELTLGDSVLEMAFSPDGSALAAINTEGKLVVWRVPE